MLTAAHDDLTRLAIAHAFAEYGQFHESVAPDDLVRVEQLGRLGPEVAAEMGAEVSMAAVPTADGNVHVCLLVAKERTQPEPV